MKAKFSVITPDAVDCLPNEALAYLDDGLKSSPTSDLMLKDVISFAKNGVGDIILVSFDSKISGAAFFMYGEGYNGKILGVVTLGGDNFNEWKKQIYDFTKELAKLKGCSQIMLITRNGWGKIFPDLQAIGTVYKLDI